jgi:chemotaxis protein methyltransferase CheR
VNGSITPQEIEAWSAFIHGACGVYLEPAKSYLLTTRLDSILKETNSSDFSDLFRKVRSSSELQTKIVEAITTNETSFFRDSSPFDLLQQKLIPELLDRRSKTGIRPIPLRIWSAACSTGQEVYTVAMVLREVLGTSDAYDVRIVGTDISNRVIAAASRGCYSEHEAQRGLAPSHLVKYFTKHGDAWRIRDEIRAMASFKKLNLLDPVVFPSQFDVVLCRNVAIYFTEQDRARLFGNVAKNLAKDGSLIIGSTESITGVCPEFQPVRHLRSLYYQFIRPV